MQIGFADTPPKGLAITINGQRFDLVDVEDYTSAAGNASQLLVWHAECSTCGQGFVTKSVTSRLPEGRRCDLHKSPGRRVRNT